MQGRSIKLTKQIKAMKIDNNYKHLCKECDIAGIIGNEYIDDITIFTDDRPNEARYALEEVIDRVVFEEPPLGGDSNYGMINDMNYNILENGSVQIKLNNDDLGSMEVIFSKSNSQIIDFKANYILHKKVFEAFLRVIEYATHNIHDTFKEYEDFLNT